MATSQIIYGSLSATTYQNLPDNVTGKYLPLSGGTVTGQTFFTSGVSITGSVETGSQVYHITDDFIVENPTINGSLLEARISGGVNIWSLNSNISIDAENRILYDSVAGGWSIDWENRQLIKSDGTTVSFDWENGILTGQTNIQSSTISATTISGGTLYGDGSNLTGISGGGSFTGGTVTGPTTFTNGLSANTFSATTYQNLPSVIQISCSDEVTVLTTGTTTTFRMPYNMLLTEVRGSLTTSQTSGNTFTVNVLNSGTTILSTLLTIDNTQKTSKALGTTQPVISTPNIIDDDEISVAITQIGSGTARGLKITLIGNRLN
jgi:hypothetical protein